MSAPAKYPSYASDQEEREYLQNLLSRLSITQLQRRLKRQLNVPTPRNGVGELNMPAIRAFQDVMSGRNLEGVDIQTRVLAGDVGGYSGILPRQDLEQTLMALFIKLFPFWAELNKKPSNGYNHAWNIQTQPGSLSDAAMLSGGESATVSDDTGSYQRLSTSIATFFAQRGVTLKMQLAIPQSGMSYNIGEQELDSGMIMLTGLVQRQLFTGNNSVTTGTATNEAGPYLVNGINGLRMALGGLGPYNLSTYNASGQYQLDLDKSGLTRSEAINIAVANIQDRGGMPTHLITDPINVANTMNELTGLQRTTTTELTPNVTVPGINTGQGVLPLISVPGSSKAMGTYNRTSDNTLVRDLYIIDSTKLSVVYLGSPDFTVLEIPMGVNGALTRRFIVYGFFGLEISDAGLYQGKIRIPA